MDRPRRQHDLPTDPFAQPNRDLVRAETDPWGLGEAPEGAALANTTDEPVRIGPDVSPGAITRSNVGVNVRGPGADAARYRSFAELANALRAELSRRLTVVAGVWASVQSRFPFNRRVAGLGLFVVACVLLIALSGYDFRGSSQTVPGTIHHTAIERLASAFTAALDWIGRGPVGPATSEKVATTSKKKGSRVKPTTGTPAPLGSLRALQLTPLVGTATVQENAPAPVGNAEVDAHVETASGEAPALAEGDSSVETAIIYSPNDTDVSPPVAIRSPGIATDRGHRDRKVSLIEILVSETGRVESATGLRSPATLGAALQSTIALSAVRTWRFRPARKNGQPVKYRTTVPFVEAIDAGRPE